MADRRPLVVVGGEVQELAVADALLVDTLPADLVTLSGLGANANNFITGAAGGSFAALPMAANEFPVRSSVGALQASSISDAAITLLPQTTYALMRSTMGAQTQDADLDTLAALGAVSSDVITGVGGGGFAKLPAAANEFFARKSTGTLAAWSISDYSITTLAQTTAGGWRTTLGLGSMATQDASAVAISGGSATLTTLQSDVQYPKVVAPPAKAAAATLTIAELLGGLIRYTGATATLTLPTAALIEAGIAVVTTNYGFQFTVTNSGAGTCTLGTATGLTLVDGMTIAAGASQQFTVRRTGASTYSIYRG